MILYFFLRALVSWWPDERKFSMRDNKLLEIVNLCLKIDTKARDIYSELASDPHNGVLHAFWYKMSEDENHHVEFWQSAAKLAQDGLLPHIIDEMQETKTQLVNIIIKIDKMEERYKSLPSISNALMLAYRLEVFMLHEAFETIFSSLPKAGVKQSPTASYEEHIQRLVHVLLRNGEGAPEIEMLGETLQQLWKKNRELVRQLSLDELTGIYNRRGFFNAAKPFLHLARRNRQAVGFMMLDIDDFKIINDTLGHQKGDEALINTAQALQRGVRASDILGRYGGEEFIVFFSSVRKDSSYQLAEKIRIMIEKEMLDHIPLTVSIGISAGGLGEKVEEGMMKLIKEADNCLYSAKNSGKNRVSFCSI